MGPHVEGLVVPLEEGEEVVAPALVWLPVAGEDVALLEHPGDIRHLDGARQRGEGRLQELRDLTQLLGVDEQATNLLHHHRRHGKLEVREEETKSQLVNICLVLSYCHLQVCLLCVQRSHALIV